MTKTKEKKLSDILKKMSKDQLEKMILEGVDQAEANAKQYLKDINNRNQKILQNRKTKSRELKLPISITKKSLKKESKSLSYLEVEDRFMDKIIANAKQLADKNKKK